LEGKGGVEALSSKSAGGAKIVNAPISEKKKGPERTKNSSSGGEGGESHTQDELTIDIKTED